MSKDVFGTYELQHDANDIKLDIVKSIFPFYRETSKDIANYQWRMFYEKGEEMHWAINIKHLPSSLSERYKHTIQFQVVGLLNSYLSNVQNDFRSIVTHSKLNSQEKIWLYFINKHKLWFSKNILKPKDIEIPESTRKLARRIFKHLTKNKPTFNHINMVLGSDVCQILKKDNDKSSSFDYWLKLSTHQKGHPILIPLKTNSYFENINGILNNGVQVNINQNNKISFRLTKKLNQETSEYISGKIGIDIGLVNLIATDYGDLFGTKFMKKMKARDQVITHLMSELQRQNIKPSNSHRYVELIRKTREAIKNEIGRIFNIIKERYQPEEIVVENLDFKNSNIGASVNRRIHKYGKKYIENKLQRFNDLNDIKITKVNPAYTSQECSNCHHVEKKNRKTRDHFECQECGLKLNADINASRNVSTRSSSEFEDINLNKKSNSELIELTRQVLSEKHNTWRETHRRISSAKDGQTNNHLSVPQSKVKKVIESTKVSWI